LILDIIIFTDGDFLKDNIYDMSEAFYGASATGASTTGASTTGASVATSATATNTKSLTTTSYKDINDIILERLRTIKNLTIK
jgi:hypothetical protein